MPLGRTQVTPWLTTDTTHVTLTGNSLQWHHNGQDGVKITNLTIVYSTVYSGAYPRKHQSSASLAFVWGIHRRPVNSPHKWPVTWKCFHLMTSSCIGVPFVSILWKNYHVMMDWTVERDKIVVAKRVPYDYRDPTFKWDFLVVIKPATNCRLIWSYYRCSMLL